MAQAIKNTKNIRKKEEKSMAHKGGVYQAIRTTTYEGRTILFGEKVKLRNPNVTNKNLKKIGEFDLDKDFEESLNHAYHSYSEVDGQVVDSYTKK